MDVLTGMRNGPRGGLGGGGFGGGMSPVLMAALGLLAYKAVKGMGSQQAPPASAGAPRPGGGLGEILGSLGLGGAAASGSTGTGLGGILSGGLGDLVRQFQNAGKGEVADSWVSTGQNRQIVPKDLSKVLTPDQIDFLTEKTGMNREELLAGLSQQLPEVVNALTPEGRIPAAHELNRTA